MTEPLSAERRPHDLTGWIDHLINASRAARPDLDSLAHEVVKRVPDELLDPVLYEGIRARVRERLREYREPKSSIGPSRWSVALSRVTLPYLGPAICIAGEWRWTEDCAPDDLRTYASEQDERAAELTAIAKKTRSYADAVEGCGAATVKQWDEKGRPGILDLAA